MTKTEAHDLLSAVRNGLLVPLHEINQALFKTGDLKTYRKAPPSELAKSEQWPFYANSRD
jgi:hypothetical protein